MPNWCTNTLIIQGEPLDLESFRNKAVGSRPHYRRDYMPSDAPEETEESALEFNNFIPIPRELLLKTYDEGGYDWERAHWGVKWGASSIDVLDNIDNGRLEYMFDTPWTPPITWLRATSANYPTLKFILKYDEDGAGFGGTVIIRKGKILRETSYSVPYEDED